MRTTGKLYGGIEVSGAGEGIPYDHLCGGLISFTELFSLRIKGFIKRGKRLMVTLTALMGRGHTYVTV